MEVLTSCLTGLPINTLALAPMHTPGLYRRSGLRGSRCHNVGLSSKG